MLYKRAEIPANTVIPALAASVTYRKQEVGGEYGFDPVSATNPFRIICLQNECTRSGAAARDGLPGLHERAKLAGGKLTVLSAPDSGTEIEVTILAASADVKALPAAQRGASGRGS